MLTTPSHPKCIVSIAISVVTAVAINGQVRLSHTVNQYILEDDPVIYEKTGGVKRPDDIPENAATSARRTCSAKLIPLPEECIATWTHC